MVFLPPLWRRPAAASTTVGAAFGGAPLTLVESIMVGGKLMPIHKECNSFNKVRGLDWVWVLAVVFSKQLSQCFPDVLSCVFVYSHVLTVFPGDTLLAC